MVRLSLESTNTGKETLRTMLKSNGVAEIVATATVSGPTT
jgi:hypothetical protein